MPSSVLCLHFTSFWCESIFLSACRSPVWPLWQHFRFLRRQETSLVWFHFVFWLYSWLLQTHVAAFADCCSLCCQTVALHINSGGFGGQSSCAFFCGLRKMCRGQAVIVSARKSASVQESLIIKNQLNMFMFQVYMGSSSQLQHIYCICTVVTYVCVWL